MKSLRHHHKSRNDPCALPRDEPIRRNLAPMPGVFPNYPAPAVRNSCSARELAMMRWGMLRRHAGGFPSIRTDTLQPQARSPYGRPSSALPGRPGRICAPARKPAEVKSRIYSTRQVRIALQRLDLGARRRMKTRHIGAHRSCRSGEGLNFEEPTTRTTCRVALVKGADRASGSMESEKDFGALPGSPRARNNQR